MAELVVFSSKFRQDSDDKDARRKQSPQREPPERIAVFHGGNYGGYHTADKPEGDEATNHVSFPLM